MRVVIAEDSAILREGLGQLLAIRGHDVVAAVHDAPALLAAVAAHRPDVAIIDIRLPPGHTDEGLRAAIRLRREICSRNGWSTSTSSSTHWHESQPAVPPSTPRW